METTIRIPRPYGLTTLTKQFQISRNPDVLKRTQTLMIQQWVSQGGFICGKPYSLAQLALFIGLPLQQVQLVLSEGFLSSPLWDRGISQEVASNLVGTAISWALEDRIDASGQVAILKNAQGTKYKPYVTAELTKAMQHKASVTASMVQVIKSFTVAPSQVNIFNNQGDASVQNNTITMEDALAIVQEEMKALPVAEMAMKCLEGDVDFEELPEVVATRQGGDFSNKEGLSLTALVDKSTIDDYKGAIQAFEKDHHEIRREIEEAIDLEAEDPELEIYK